MELSQLLTLEGIGWFLILLGWIIQLNQAYLKRSTRISKKSIVMILLGTVGLTISAWIKGLSMVIFLQMAVILIAWLVYIRRR